MTSAQAFAGSDVLPAASSLLSSQWSRDNLVTSHPARLYNGAVLERFDLESLAPLLQDLERTQGPIRRGAVRRGSLTWDIECESADGPFVLQLPRVLDERGSRARSTREVPWLAAENSRHFSARGLNRFVVAPRDVMTLCGRVPAATFAALPDYRTLSFARGAVQLEISEGNAASQLALGAHATADVLAEMVAALVYHYEPDATGGTAVTDVSINDGDFALKRSRDGSFELRLKAIRHLESGIAPSLLLLYLVQLIAYEAFQVDDAVTELPVLISNPSVAFEGVVRGLRYRHRDLGFPAEAAPAEARRWIREFGLSPEGRAYRPWTERFLDGDLPLEFGADLRERWWRLLPLQTRLGLLELRARQDPDAAGSARPLRQLLERLSNEIGRTPQDEPHPVRLDDLGSEPAPRPIANPEIFGRLVVSQELEPAAVEAFPSFEAYMDAALHDPKWGYYAQRVLIGHDGHFDTNPESLSPHYGQWLATRAFELWQDMLVHGELAETDPFSIVEFGAGNGRLAADLLTAIAARAANRELESQRQWSLLAERVEYRIYEMSESLREKQRALLGPRARVDAGDARHPLATLRRDFPGGLRGLVLTNEVPDAFGVHKVVLSATGEAFAALVVPRVERSLADAVNDELRERALVVDRSLRERFGWSGHSAELYLDAGTHALVMQALASLPPERRGPLLHAVWCEEVYVPAAHVPELAAHFCDNAGQYAAALATEDSGVVLYVNVHADRFVHELGAALVAGFVVTIDYGDTTAGLVHGARRGEFPFRIYADGAAHVPKPNDPYSGPGEHDMTADIDFTALARAGAHAGLSLVHYGPERDLVGAALPEVLRAAVEHEAFASFLGNPVFKVLVLGTRHSSVFSGPLMTPLPLTSREEDVPEARRPRILDIAATLASASGARDAGVPGER